MRLAWMTDIHLDFLSESQIKDFIEVLVATDADAYLMTGDIGIAQDFDKHLIQIADSLQKPIYFVLGNHDYYRSSIAAVREKATQLHQQMDNLYWLPLSGAIALSEDTYLVGHGGWSDGGYGHFIQSPVVLNDYLLIEDLSRLRGAELLEKITILGQESADYLHKTLTPLMPQGKKIIIATHSPPFQETAWHEGNTPDDDHPYLPHFTCKAIGDALLNLANQYPQADIQVLCGHTHGYGERQILPNLHVITGGSEYEKPMVQDILRL